MNKKLLFIAAAVILLTVAIGSVKIYEEIVDVRDEDAILTDVGVFALSVLLILMITSEVGLFGGAAFLLSMNRTPLKVVFGMIIVIISLIFLISLIRSFWGLDIKPTV